MKSGMECDSSDFLCEQSALQTRSRRAEFRYQGKDAFIDGVISLLVALKASGARLTDLNGYGGGGVLVQRGTLTFQVTGTSDEVERFIRAYFD